ncbi:MAG: hypothetical protein ACFCVF_15795 [Kineosporiaceae bacterium]
MAVTGGRGDRVVDLRDYAPAQAPPHTPPRPPRVVLAAVPPPGRPATGRSGDLAVDPGAEPAHPAQPGRGRSPFAAVALVALGLLVVDTAVGVLPDRALAEGVPVLEFLTVQRVVVAVGLLGLLLAAPRPSTFLTPVDLPLLALVALAGTALFLDGQSMAAWRALVTAVAVFYLAVGVVRRHADAVPALLVTVLGASFVAAAIGVQQYVDGVDTGFYRVGLTNSDIDGAGAVTRSTGTFSNPNLLAGYLVLALPLTLGLLTRRASRRLRMAWLVLAGIGVAGLVVTFSRGAIAAFAVVVVAGVTVAVATRRGPGAWPAVLAVGGTGLLTAVAVGAVTGVLGRATGRDELWSAALTAARTGGPDGVGYGRAGDVMSSVGDASYAHAHNLWLNWLVDTGPAGPVLISLVLGIGLVAGARRAFAGSALAGGAVAGLAAVGLASVLDHPTTVSSILTLFMVALACAVAGPLPHPGPRGRHAVERSDGDERWPDGAPAESGPVPGTPPTAASTGPVPPMSAGWTRASAAPDPGVPDPGVPDPGVPDPGVPGPAVLDPAVPDPPAAAPTASAGPTRLPRPVSIPRRLTQEPRPAPPNAGLVPPPASAPDDTAPLAGPRRGRRAAARSDDD